VPIAHLANGGFKPERPMAMTIDARIAPAYLSIGADSDFFCEKKELFYF
jgi:hypothetical protein